MSININPQIAERLRELDLNVDDALIYLIAKHYNLEPSYIPAKLKLQVLSTGILTDKNKPSLFKSRESVSSGTFTIGMPQVKEFRDWFKKINPGRASSIDSCSRKLKRFLDEHPDVTFFEVISATKLYLESVDDPKYLIYADNFIYRGIGEDENSPLESWVEKVKDNKEEINNRHSNYNTMR